MRLPRGEPLGLDPAGGAGPFRSPRSEKTLLKATSPAREHENKTATPVEQQERTKCLPMRTLGVASLGLVCGLLAGLLAQEVIARIATFGDGQISDSLQLAIVLGFLVPALAIVGAGAALTIDGRMRRR